MKNIYIMSDLHGQDKAFFQMLEKIKFSSQDFLFIIGDVGDRGPNGIMLLQYIMKQDNMCLLMGNHEEMMLEAVEHEDDDKGYMSNWMFNGGEATLEGLKKLSEQEREECLEYVRNLPLYQKIVMNETTYLLVHAGIIPTEDKKNLEHAKVTKDELLWTRYEFLQSDMIMPYCIIFGHTPTPALPRYAKGLSIENQMRCKEGKMIHWRNRIAIDCGAGFGKKLGCLRLNDMLEFYIRIKN